MGHGAHSPASPPPGFPITHTPSQHASFPCLHFPATHICAFPVLSPSCSLHASTSHLLHTSPHYASLPLCLCCLLPATATSHYNTHSPCLPPGSCLTLHWHYYPIYLLAAGGHAPPTTLHACPHTAAYTHLRAVAACTRRLHTRPQPGRGGTCCEPPAALGRTCGSSLPLRRLPLRLSRPSPPPFCHFLHSTSHLSPLLRRTVSADSYPPSTRCLTRARALTRTRTHSRLSTPCRGSLAPVGNTCLPPTYHTRYTWDGFLALARLPSRAFLPSGFMHIPLPGRCLHTSMLGPHPGATHLHTLQRAHTPTTCLPCATYRAHAAWFCLHRLPGTTRARVRDLLRAACLYYLTPFRWCLPPPHGSIRQRPSILQVGVTRQGGTDADWRIL